MRFKITPVLVVIADLFMAYIVEKQLEHFALKT
jgi:hypothetical protein